MDQGAQVKDEGVFETVKNALAFAASAEDAFVDEEPKVFGDVGLGGTGGGDDFGDALGGRAKGLEDAQAGGFAEGLKEGGDVVEFGLGEWSGLTHL